MMDTLKIKAFLLIDKYHSFSKTAEAFSYTPSAVSHMADALEEELGRKLFIRTNKGVEITEAGKSLRDKFEKLLKAEKDLTDAAAILSKNQESLLKIGSFSSIALYLLPELLQSFKTAYPSVKTTILIDDYMQDWLETGIADIVFTDSFNSTKQWFPFKEDDFVAVVPETWFDGKTEISVEELYLHPFIRPDEAILNSTAMYMVKEGLGITVLPHLSTRLTPDGVKILKLTPKISRTIGVEYDSSHLTWAAKCFLSHVKEFMN